MGHARRNTLLWVLLGLVATHAACGGETAAPPAPCGRLSVAVTDGSGNAPALFQVLADPGGDGWRSVDCSPGGLRPDGATCVGGVATFALARAVTLGLTVKAPGYRTVRTTATPAWNNVSDAAAPAGCAGRVSAAILDVAMVALPAPVVTDDYRTAFAADGGLDAFVSQAYAAADDLGPAYVVKFFLDGLDGDITMYFQEMHPALLHYTFVHQVLKRSLTEDEFLRLTYHGADRKQMAGSLIWRPALRTSIDGADTTGVLTIEYFPNDDLTPALATAAFEALQERLPFLALTGAAQRLVYLPSGSFQEAQARDAARDLAVAGVTWASRSDLYAGITEQRLNPGVTFGTLRKMTPEELATAVVSYKDIVLLTRLPLDLPLVGGTITEDLQTPLAHVNVAARARGTPNLALLRASSDPRVAPYLDRRVRFEVTRSEFTIREATIEETDAFWRDRLDRPPLDPAFDVTRDGLIPFADLGFDDPATVGVKAANLAELRRLLPANVPDGFAVPFYYYDGFVNGAGVTADECAAAGTDCLANGLEPALCTRVEAFCNGPVAGTGTMLQGVITRLEGDPEVATDSVLRNALLAATRFLFCHVPLDPAFASALDQRVREQFGTAKVRLRSSSNAEDLPDFSGAGLYTSVGATLGTGKPPSARICQVWGSLWNWKAYEERSFWNVVHASSRMGVGVHNAFPDEQANGVLITQNIADPFTVGMYVNVQKGEVSVTNPEGDETPEIFTIVPSPAGVQVARQRFSSLSPDTALLTDAEVQALYLAAWKVQLRFAALYKVPEYNLALDIEFKFHGPARDLILKQVRPFRGQ